MATIHYARTDEFARKGEKYDFLDQHAHVGGVAWQILAPDRRHTWLTEGMQVEFEGFVPVGDKETKSSESQAVFQLFSNGIKTNRDAWVYNFNKSLAQENIQRLITTYNEHVYRWIQSFPKLEVEDFVTSDPSEVSWSAGLKDRLRAGDVLEYDESKIRKALYRPFTQMYLYFDRHLNERRYQMPDIFPEWNSVNKVIWIKVGSEWPMFALLVDKIPDLLPQGGSQCFPFYTYDEDGSNRRENITDWALAQFQAHYAHVESTIQAQNPQIEKWDIFHYVYALLHHPDYRRKYAANLRRELPRIPFVQDFWGFVAAGRRLAEIHVGYEQQPEYPLRWIENQDKQLNWRVERMRLSRDRRTLAYNDFLTLDGIPPEVYDYRLGNRSALEWVIDQYAVSVDKRSGIANDPNNPDDPQYIVRLIGQVITVSVETVQIVNRLPPLQIA